MKYWKQRKKSILPAMAGMSVGILAFSASGMAQNANRTVQPGLGKSVTISSKVIAQAGSLAAGANIDCTVYGEGYVVVQGTTRCVRIRGRMRVNQQDSGYRGANYLPYAGWSGAALPAAMQQNKFTGQIGR